jgi:GT2 family glycosyltransferase
VNITNGDKIPGFLITTYDDMGDLPTFWNSLMSSLPDEYAYGVLTVDAGSTDGSNDFMEKYGPVFKTYKDLSVALNKGIWEYVGDLVDGEFQRKKVKYVVWLHPDMRFPEKKWLENLVDFMETHPDMGKVHPDLVEAPGGDRPGNQCPWIIPVDVLKRLQVEVDSGNQTFPGHPTYKQKGKWFNEDYLLCGGREDWSLNNRIMRLGYKVWITGSSLISHRSMGTRSRKDNNWAASMNANLYFKEWGTYNPLV